MANDYIIHFGLGDWCAADPTTIPPSILTDTGYFAYDAKLLAGFARLLGKSDDAEKYEAIYNNVRAAFRKTFRKADADWGSGMMVDLAAAVYFGMTEPEETAAICAELDKRLKADYYRLSFGILGAKFIPRVLADNGYADTAYAVFSQPAFPGYVDWVRHDATSLWENAQGTASRNHIMFGDIYAWFMAYPGGFRPQVDKLVIQPVMPSAMPAFKAAWHGAETRWDGEKFTVALPEDMSAEVVLPDGSRRMQNGGTVDYVLSMN
jgi:alpha-L-rhamnosidase